MKKFPYTLDPSAIPTKKIVDVETGRVAYQCHDDLWREHFDAWCSGASSCTTEQEKDKLPEPMPWGHCMFKRPTSYGRVPFGCTDPVEIRKAHESRVRGNLDGWDRDMSKEQLDKIVNATVDAKMKGVDVGAFPFIACIYSGL